MIIDNILKNCIIAYIKIHYTSNKKRIWRAKAKLKHFLSIFCSILSIVFPFYIVATPAIAGDNCSFADIIYADHWDNYYDPEEAWEFGAEIQNLVRERDLHGLFRLVKGELQNGPRKYSVARQSFEQVFDETWRTSVLKSDAPCAPIGWRGFNLGNGRIWFNRGESQNSWHIFAINGASEEPYQPTSTHSVWRFGGKIILPQCFSKIWMSYDNYEVFEQNFGIINTADFREFPGRYFGKEITSIMSIAAPWGTGEKISLARLLRNCTSQSTFVLKNTKNSVSVDADGVSAIRCGEDVQAVAGNCIEEAYRLLSPLSQEVCQSLAPNLSGRCEAAHLVRFGDYNGGSMGWDYRYNIYGLFTLDDGTEVILPLVNFNKENEARNFIERLDTSFNDERVTLNQSIEETQESLIWLGHYNGIVDGVSGQRTKAAIESFEEAEGFEVNGVLSPSEYSDLVSWASAEKAYVGWTKFIHKRLSYEISYPATIMTNSLPLANGGRRFFSDDYTFDLRVEITKDVDSDKFSKIFHTLSSSDRDIHFTYRRFLNKFFVISGESDNKRFYTKVHHVSDHIIGFTFVWPREENAVYERMAIAFASAFSPPDVIGSLPNEEKVPQAKDKQARGPVKLTPTQPKDNLSSVEEIPPKISHSAQNLEKLSAEQVFAKASNAVWTVLTAPTMQELTENGATGSGSAVAVSRSSLFTNCHVFDGMGAAILFHRRAGEEDDVEVRFVSRLIGDKDADICFIEIDGAPLQHKAEIGNIDTVRIGARVYSIGSPSGLDLTFGDGLISAFRDYDGIAHIQTSAPVSPGSSGGGLFNERGELIAITTMTVADAQSLNFAISVDEFMKRY